MVQVRKIHLLEYKFCLILLRINYSLKKVVPHENLDLLKQKNIDARNNNLVDSTNEPRINYKYIEITDSSLRDSLINFYKNLNKQPIEKQKRIICQ